MTRTRVLHVINSLTFGGAEVLLTNSLAPGGLQEYTDNYLAYFMGESSLITRIDRNVTLIPLQYKGRLDLVRLLGKLRKIIKENQISIVHTHSTPADIYTRLVLPSKVKQIHTVHSTYSMDYTARTYNRYLEKYLLFRRKDCNLIFLSDYNKQDFLKTLKFKGKAFVLNNFISDDFFQKKLSFYPANATTLKVIAVGMLREEKNYPYLLEIFSFLKGYNISLDIYGSGDKKKEYEKTVSEKGLNIRFMGQHDQVHTVIQNYNLFILPSKFEGFGLSIFEAMASGVPVMVSSLDSLKSILNDNALYFELNNAERTAAQLKDILQNKIDINAMADKARDYAIQTVKKDIYIKKLLEIYGQLLK